MTLPLAISLASALIAGAGGILLVGLWPRRLTAEEWVLHRRAVSRASAPQPSIMSMPAHPAFRRGWPGRQGYGEAARIIQRDLRVGRLSGSRPLAHSFQSFRDELIKAAMTGSVAGVVLAVLGWQVGVIPEPWTAGIGFALIGATTGVALRYLQMRRAATQARRLVIRRLPRVITGARMVMESGAATPESALAMAVSLYADPASDVIREAIRIREVQKVNLEDGLDRVGDDYGLAPLGQLADAFRIGRRYGTPMGDVLAGFALELRREWHATYRERITRAPVLMTIPALVFFVAPLLLLILFLVFSPLFTVLHQL